MVLSVKPANAHFVFRALADPTRRAIFEQLSRQGEQTVHALTRHAGVSQPAVSKHLTVLKRARLVQHRREGRETHYRAQPDALTPMVDWLRDYGAFWRDRFDRLETLLERMKPLVLPRTIPLKAHSLWSSNAYFRTRPKSCGARSPRARWWRSG